MSKKSLKDLYAEHTGKVTDKWSLYLTEYDRIFSDYRDEKIRLFEIGVQNGGSLEVWGKYFRNATIILGCDINSDCSRLTYSDPRIGIIIGNSNSAEVQEQVLQRSEQYEIIIDDGSHFSSDIIKAFSIYFSSLTEGGIYVAEDLHCSYWDQFEGGLYDPYSSLSFFKRLADIVSHEHWGVPKARSEILRGSFTRYNCSVVEDVLSQVHSVEFINSMCVIRKAEPEQNCLGNRIISGLEEIVVPNMRNLVRDTNSIANQTLNSWATRKMPPDEDILNVEATLVDVQKNVVFLNQAITRRDEQITVLSQFVSDQEGKIRILNQTVAEREQQAFHANDELQKVVTERNTLLTLTTEIQSSTAWRITQPMRIVGAGLFRALRICRQNLNIIKNKTNRQEDNSNKVYHEIPDGVTGYLELPPVETMPQLNFVTVSGWLTIINSSVKRVYATVNGSSEQAITFGYERPDVQQVYPNEANSLKSGFYGIVNWDNKLKDKIVLEIWAETDNGEKKRCFSRELIRQSSTPTKLKSTLFQGYLSKSLNKAWRALREGRLPLSPISWWGTLRRDYLRASIEARGPLKFSINRIPALVLEPYEQWIQTNRITPKLEILMRSAAEILNQQKGIKISIVVPVYNTPPNFLEEMINSVTSQYFENWELILIDDASPQPHIREVLTKLQKQDHRIRVVFRSTNGHISEATNDGLKVATGEFIALLDHDDTLPPDVLLHVAECIAKNPEVDWIYTDEDKIDSSGRRYDPQFKAGWSPEMAITHNYTHHLTVIRTSLVDKVGGMRKGFEGAQDLDLFLRVAENTTPGKIKHIPQIGYHWRCHEASTASKGTQKTYIFDSADRAIKDALKRRELNAEPFLPPIAKQYGMCLNQLRWIDSIGPGKEVTIIIPTKDRIDLLQRCISSLNKTCDKRFVKILIIDDRSKDEETLKYLQELEISNLLECRVVRPQRSDGLFNYARLINEGATYVETKYMLQLNNDVEAIEPGWLEDMMGWILVDGVGAVGAKLLYPNNTIQHAGVVIGPNGGLADHQFHQLPEVDVGYLALLHAARNVSAVTGACMLTTTELFRNLGGFDEANFAVEFNDVDFCLRILASGGRVVCTPQATLTHLTSASRGKSFNPQEHINFITKYKHFEDAFYNPNIRQDAMWMPVDGFYFTHADRVKKIRILLISHALSLTGAPIVAYEFARYFVTEMKFDVTVLALEQGPLHQMYDELGIPVIVTHELDGILFFQETKLQDVMQKLGNLLHIADEYDLVVCNTLTTFWSVILANQAKIPAIWHIHESVGVDSYASTFLDPEIGKILAQAFLKASRVVFQANATRAMYGEFEAIANLCTIPGGLPLQRIEQFKEFNSKIALRKKYNIPADSYVVILVGTTCERKGQAVFLEAINQIPKDENTANVTFLLVGAIKGLYLEGLKEIILRLDLRNVQLVAETKDIYDYYALSDLFVCASFEESFPMVVLLAMAFELPIVSTDVFGIPEIVSDKGEALLLPPGNPQLLSAAIIQCINGPVETNAMAARAYAKVKRLFDSEILLAKHADLARKVSIENAHETLQ